MINVPNEKMPAYYASLEDVGKTNFQPLLNFLYNLLVHRLQHLNQRQT